jgi:carboxyl-terminal processing protease
MATLPKFKTAGGRTVYGGGGIYPDVIVKDDPNLTPAEVGLIQNRVFWEFATKYEHAHKDIKWTPDVISQKNFQLGDADWKQIQQIAKDRKVVVGDSVWTDDKPFVVRQIRAELASNTMGQLERYKVLVEDDVQLNHALEMFPRASKLMSGNFDVPEPAATTGDRPAQAPLKAHKH